MRDKEREHLPFICYPLFTTLLAERSPLINIHSDLHYFTGRRSCWQRHRWKHSELTDNKRKHSAIYRRSTSRQKWGWYCSGRRDRHLNNDTNKAVPVATTVVTHCKQCGVGVTAFGTSLGAGEPVSFVLVPFVAEQNCTHVGVRGGEMREGGNRWDQMCPTALPHF